MKARNYKLLMFCNERYFITNREEINMSFDFRKFKKTPVKNHHYIRKLLLFTICKYKIQAKCDKIKIQE